MYAGRRIGKVTTLLLLQNVDLQKKRPVIRVLFLHWVQAGPRTEILCVERDRPRRRCSRQPETDQG
jgi:hypothetical protein